MQFVYKVLVASIFASVFMHTTRSDARVTAPMTGSAQTGGATITDSVTFSTKDPSGTALAIDSFSAGLYDSSNAFVQYVVKKRGRDSYFVCFYR